MQRSRPSQCGKTRNSLTQFFPSNQLETGTGILNRSPFCFFPWGCSLFQVGHTQFEFPATYGEEMQKGPCCRQDSNPRPSGYEPDMLPQDQQGFDDFNNEKLWI